MQLTGIHDLTAMKTAAAINHDVYTRFLGLWMDKKAIDQDVVGVHLFFIG